MRRNIVPIRKTTAPATEFERLHQEIDNLFDNMWSGFSLTPFSRNEWRSLNDNSMLALSIDVTEDDKHYEVTAELPGLTEDDVKITLSQGMLTLSGEKTESTENKEKDYHIYERSYGKFKRQVKLPQNVDESAITAQFKNGVLHVSIPKTETEQSTTKEIPISR